MANVAEFKSARLWEEELISLCIGEGKKNPKPNYTQSILLKAAEKECS